MNKEFIPYEQALELKELGFDLECVMYVWDPSHKTTDGHIPSKTPHWTPLHILNHNQLPTRVSLPLYQQAFRWFREKYKLTHCIDLEDNTRNFNYDITIYDSKNRQYHDDDMIDQAKPINLFGVKIGSYEEAEQACLNKLIEIVKQ